MTSIYTSISSLRRDLKSRSVSTVEIVEGCLDRIKKSEHLNIYIEVFADSALEQARRLDDLLKGEDYKLRPLDGCVVSIKDVLCYKGHRVTAASHILGDYISPYTATAVQKLIDAGAIIIGRTNCDEFAMGSSNETSAYGPVINPWRKGEDLVPGGSSGGSAAAVAADLCLGATATDTGGSIRQPASFTGTVGIKPTYGRCSRWGTVAFASSLDQAGPIAKTVKDAAILLESMAGYDAKDSTSLNVDVPKWSKSCGKSVKGLRIGIPKEYMIDGMPPEIQSLWDKGVEWMKEAGAEIVPITLPHTKYALPAYYVVAPAEASSNLARYDGMRYGLRVEGKDLNDTYDRTRTEGFGDEVRRRIMIGTYVLSAGYYDAYYLRAQKVRTRIVEDFENAWQSCDAILTPTAPSAPFAVGRKVNDPVQMYLNDIFTVTTNLAGLPGISVPAGLNDDGLPLGLQIIGKALDEDTVFAAASALEKAAGFSAKPEKWWS